ncbi:sterol desaturase family protein [Luteibaculum oceani]|uniref:Sterol desaturase family protein n=1 Tax=Luteibaculum oceani TaxID=1294296 RepID=A0A5C6VDE8_9FLAO|nr:sterol desaturase family protein [Luteibaculum oceani]TXC81675.1 sterol desaturase family protein [Luteibaculum oceani]
MGKEKVTLEQITQLDFNTVIWIAAPIMFALVGLEYFITTRKNMNAYTGKDFLASAAIGFGNLFVNGLTKIGVFSIIVFFYNITPWSIPPTWWSYLLCLVVLDFCRYWAHRIAHEQRFWWSTHVVHHSSEHYNFSVSFRLSWTQNLKLVFFLPVIMMGFDPVVFFIIHQIEVLYQFWIHTELIRKLPKPIEFIFTTPSHHRVHHAKNDKYIDKNYGSTFIIWDRIFGTFQPEEEQPVYGITKPVNSYNPVVLVFHAWGDLIKDIYKRPTKALQIMFGSPTDWEREEMKKREVKTTTRKATKQAA